MPRNARQTGDAGRRKGQHLAHEDDPCHDDADRAAAADHPDRPVGLRIYDTLSSMQLLRRQTSDDRGRTRSRWRWRQRWPLSACDAGGFWQPRRQAPYAPDAACPARADSVDGLIVGHRLMAAGEYELALKAYARAAAEQRLTVDVLSALGSANLKLGRLGQAETLLRQATDEGRDLCPGLEQPRRRADGTAAKSARRPGCSASPMRSTVANPIDPRQPALGARKTRKYLRMMIRQDTTFALVRRGPGRLPAPRTAIRSEA